MSDQYDEQARQIVAEHNRDAGRQDRRDWTELISTALRAAADGARREAVPYPLLGTKVRVTDRSRYYADWRDAELVVTGVDLLPSGVITVTTAESDGLSQYGDWRNPTDGWAPDELETFPTPPQPDPVTAAREVVVKAARRTAPMNGDTIRLRTAVLALDAALAAQELK